jgi:hypothetical protein
MTLFSDRVEFTVQLMQAEIDKRRLPITADLRVAEDAAAELLGYSPGHLKNMRAEGRGPTAYRCGVGKGSRVSYRLHDLARWIESERDNF